MNNLFERANNIGLGCIRSWLPNGRHEKEEWVALNPTRADNNIGSFRINLQTGKWIDFATSDAGADAVSLYAYLNRSYCEGEASTKGYKNREGGIQAEAARAILEKYDPGYFPGDDDFTPPVKKKKGVGWEDFHCLEDGMKDPPNLDTTWFQDKWGTEVERWDFHNSKGSIVMKAVRFITESGNKSDRPFTLWTDGPTMKWRAKSLPGLYPLWGLLDLLQKPNEPIVLFEGQKAASRARNVIGEEYVCLGWYGGVNAIDKNDWSYLTGREIYFWPDADIPGRAVIKKLREKDIKVNIVYSPPGVKKGWDIADAIAEQWTKEQILELITGSKEKNATFLDENDALPFRVLGMTKEEIFFHNYRSKMVVEIKASSLNSSNLIRVAPMDWWGLHYAAPQGGIAWKCIADDLLRRAEIMKQFDEGIVRRSGAWCDGETIVFHAGDHLIVNKERIDLCDRNGSHVYEKSRILPIDLEKQLSDENAKQLMTIFDYIPMCHEAQKFLLAGWMFLAPFGGCLKWRPHIWITGPAGSGKSWLLENIIYRMVGDDFGVKGMGTSTPAGIRQALQSNSLCVILDEMESDNKKYADYIEQNLKLFREASSGIDGSAGTLHGTIDQSGKQWVLKSMACFASIGATLKQDADMDRFTLITLDTLNSDIETKEKRFLELKKAIEFLTPEWSRAFHSRTLSIIDEVIRCIDVMVGQAASLLENRRYGDQLGTLMAGAWMIMHNRSATAKEAKEWLFDMDISSLNNVDEKRSTEDRVFEELLSYRVNISNGHEHSIQSIGACLEYLFDEALLEENKKSFPGATDKGVKQTLEGYGIKVINENGRWLCVAAGHPGVRKILERTHFPETYVELLRRLDICDGKLYGPGRFAGIRKRFLRLDIEKILDEIPF